MRSHLLILACGVVAITLSLAAQDVNQSADALLKSGDVVSVILSRFNGNTVTMMTYGGSVIVDGKLNVPVLGEVQAGGLTVEEFKQVLQGRYGKRITVRHEISVTVGVPPPARKYPMPPPWKWIPLEH